MGGPSGAVSKQYYTGPGFPPAVIFPKLFRLSGRLGCGGTLAAYGEGPLPAFENPDNASAYAINLSGDWIEVSRVQVRKVFLQGINVGSGSEHTLFRGIEVYQCGLGVYLSGRYSRVTASYFHDLNTMVNTPGAGGRYGSGVWGRP